MRTILVTHKFDYSICAGQSADLSEMIYHENIEHNIDNLKSRCEFFADLVKGKLLQTVIIFHNGLTLKMLNVPGTKFDISKSFDEYINAFLDLKKKRAKNKIELNRANADMNVTPNRSTSRSKAPSTSSNVTAGTMQSRSQTGTIDDSSESFELMEQNVFIHGITSKLDIRSLDRFF